MPSEHATRQQNKHREAKTANPYGTTSEAQKEKLEKAQEAVKEGTN